MEAIASTAQDLWASLAARVVSDPLVLVLLVVLAVCLRWSSGSRSAEDRFGERCEPWRRRWIRRRLWWSPR